MNDKYLDTSNLFLFLLKRRKSKYCPSSGKVWFYINMNFKIFREPVSLFLKFYIFSASVYGHPAFDTSNTTKLLIFLHPMLEMCDHGLFKFVF